jgi:hypothetical protein
MTVVINPHQVASLITERIFRDYQCGMGTTDHPVAISVDQKSELTRAILEVIKSEDEGVSW